MQQTIAQAAVQVAVDVILAVNEEIRRQAMGTIHHNTSETIRSYTGGSTFTKTASI